MKKRIHYFDHAATTPLDPRVEKAMRPYFSRDFGNPSNLYELGRRAKRAIFDATEKIANAIGCRPGEIVYTGSATEADNLALAGIARANKGKGNKIIISAVEHKGILSVAAALQKEGFEVVELPVNTKGLVDLAHLEKALDERTILVSVTSADSETGTLQPIAEISKIIQNFRECRISNVEFRKTQHSTFNIQHSLPYMHTDASQAVAYLDMSVDKLGVDLMTLSAHKLGGPKGIGALYVREGTDIKPIIYGGGQGRLRSGTENVPGIVGFGEAMRLAKVERKKEAVRLSMLRDRLEKGIIRSIPKVVVNGHPTKRLPNFLNISILDIEGEAMLLHLDEKGILVNTGSACNSESLEPSYVLRALGSPYEFVHGSIRFTLGKQTTKDDVDYVLRELPPIIKTLRKISPLNLDLHSKQDMSLRRAFVGNKTPHFLRKKK